MMENLAVDGTLDCNGIIKENHQSEKHENCENQRLSNFVHSLYISAHFISEFRKISYLTPHVYL